MALIPDIAKGWRNPADLAKAKLGKGEGAALATLLGACAMIFLAQWPRLAREAHLDPEVPMDARLGAALMGIMFLLPLILYGVAVISQLVAWLFGARIGGYGARVALFWALLCLSPLLLLHGLAIGFLGQGAAVLVLGLLVAAGFGYLWVRMLAGVRE